MKTVRCNTETFRKMMKVKHPLELERMDVVNMSDVLDVIMWRYEKLVEGEDLEEVMATKFRFQDTADVAAQPILDGEEDEDEEDMKPKAPRKKRTASKAAAAKRRKRPADDEEDED